MLSPYDWQQSISQRAQYIENRLRSGSPIVGLSIEDGCVLYTYRKNIRKVYEVYDRVMFSAIGQQADVESMRVTSIDFAHQEGYAHSEDDVKIGRLVGFALSGPMKRAFGDLTIAPFVIQALFAELNARQADDLFIWLHYDGDFFIQRNFAVVAGTRDGEERMTAFLSERYKSDMSFDQAFELADAAWRIGADRDVRGGPDEELVAGAYPEVGMLERNVAKVRRFRLLHRDEKLSR